MADWKDYLMRRPCAIILKRRSASLPVRQRRRLQEENAYEVARRLMACLSDLAVDGQNQTLGVVTHGHALQALIWWLKGADPQEDLRRYGHRNCGYAMLDATASGFNLLNWGVATHLLPQR